MRRIKFSPEETYHIYNRGNDKKVIFIDNHDYNRFMVLMYLCNNTVAVDIRKSLDKGEAFVKLFNIIKEETLVDIIAFSLMPNHFHFLLYEKTEGGISSFMQRLSTAYAMYFNARNDRTGSLFEGAFKARYVDTYPYLSWVFSYIHLNPLKLTVPDWKLNAITDVILVKDFMRNYMYSSYYDYFVDERPQGSIISKNIFSSQLQHIDDLEEIIREFNSHKGEAFVEK